MRTPRGRSKKIFVPGTAKIPRYFMLGKLNNYDKTLKKHRGQLSFMSDLESIDEVEFSDHFDQSFFYKQEEEEEKG